MGHIIYYLAYKHQPVRFRRGANPGKDTICYKYIILHSSDISMYPVNYVMNWSDIAVVQKTREPSAAFNMKKYCYTITLVYRYPISYVIYLFCFQETILQIYPDIFYTFPPICAYNYSIYKEKNENYQTYTPTYGTAGSIILCIDAAISTNVRRR
jgi:hypothetical protein